MNSASLPFKSGSGGGQSAFAIADEIPLTFRQAGGFLGVSPQTVCLWVERKQIPHLRVMGRNIRFLKSDLEPFRPTFKQEENGKTQETRWCRLSKKGNQSSMDQVSRSDRIHYP